MDQSSSRAFDLLDETARSNFLRFLMQSFHCTYVCFWSFVPTTTNCLRFQDGMYCEELNTQMASSSSGSLAQRLFHEYRQSIFAINVENEHVPGYAFKNSFPYLEFQELELRRRVSNETQKQFYQEARIKTAIFMGFKVGEIELGLPNVPTINTKVEIQSLFHQIPEDFQTNNITTQPKIAHLHHHELNPILPTEHQNPHYSSSSSSLRSLSNIDSPEYSSLLFNINIPNTTNNNITTSSSSQVQETVLSQLQHINCPSPQILRRPIISSTPDQSIINPHQQAMQDFARLRNPNFPSQEAEDETMMKAILAVLTSSTPPPPLYANSISVSASSSSPAYSAHLVNPKSSAFKRYYASSEFSPGASSLDRHHHHQLGSKKSMLRRSIHFFQSLARNRQITLQIPRPSSTQLHHMMSERKRREKLNESFHALRALLPPGTKKDKASLLNTTKEYLASLKAQIDELSRRNKQLEAQLFPTKKEANIINHNIDRSETLMINDQPCSSSSDHQQIRAIDVRLRHLSESASSEDETEMFDLQVIVRAAISVEDLVLRLLEFLKRHENISFVSMEANTTDLSSTQSTAPINRVILRLRISKGSQWDESALQEAVRRVVADLAQ